LAFAGVLVTDFSGGLFGLFDRTDILDYFPVLSRQTADDTPMMKRHIFRVVTRGPEGEYRVRDYVSDEEIRRWHVQTGVTDYSLDNTVRGRPIFKGLIGPMPEAGGVLRYESPEVFEQISKEWGEQKRKYQSKKRKCRRDSG